MVGKLKKLLLKVVTVKALSFILSYIGGVSVLLSTIYYILVSNAPVELRESIEGLTFIAKMGVAFTYSVLGVQTVNFILPWITSGFTAGFISGGRYKGILSAILLILIPIAILAVLTLYRVEEIPILESLIPGIEDETLKTTTQKLVEILKGNHDVNPLDEALVKFYTIIGILTVSGYLGGRVGEFVHKHSLEIAITIVAISVLILAFLLI